MSIFKTEVSCLCCNVNFLKKNSEIKKSSNHFCSRSCAAKINNLGKRRHPPRNCIKCNKEYVTTKDHNSLRRCKECLADIMKPEESKKMTIEQHLQRDSIKNKHPSWKMAQIRAYNRSWNKNLIKLPCQVCNYDKHTELAHIKPIHSFSLDTELGIVNDPCNILVLCRNHHWEFDNNLLKLQDIPKRN